MNKQADYTQRINTVTNYVAANLNKSHSVQELAAIAHFSEFHFHRVYYAVTGETLASMVNRLRLEGAAATLIYQKRRPITHVALDHGYSSGANFTKAFTKYFGQSPSNYRSTQSRPDKLSRIGKASEAALSDNFLVKQDVTIVNRPDTKLAYLRQTGAYDHSKIAHMHKAVDQWVKTHNCAAHEPASIGITWSDSHIAAVEQWRYDACVAVQPDTQASDGISIQNLAEGPVAQCLVSLPADANRDLTPYWNWFITQWLLEHQYELRASPSYEIYDQADARNRFDVHLCLPLIPTTARN